MRISASLKTRSESTPRPPAALSAFLALACGLVAANIYYAQPLAALISASAGLSAQATGLIVTFTQLGYGLGLLLIVPLGDLVESRKLASRVLAMGALALLMISLAGSATVLLLCAFLVGLGSVTVQILVPYASYLAAAPHRGRVVGNVMAGLMLGIMLARPVASLIAYATSWEMVFRLSSVLMAALVVVLNLVLPKRLPEPGLCATVLFRSMASLLRHNRVLQRKAAYHACMFAAFSFFWTTIPLLLASAPLALNQADIALFALVGVSGAVAAPVAGRLADKGLSRPVTVAVLAVAGGVLVLGSFSFTDQRLELALLGGVAIVLDFCVAANLVLGQRALFCLDAALRSRLNGLYMSIFFAGGALGSAGGAWLYSRYGWQVSALAAAALPGIALCYSLFDIQPGDTSPTSTSPQR